MYKKAGFPPKNEIKSSELVNLEKMAKSLEMEFNTLNKKLSQICDPGYYNKISNQNEKLAKVIKEMRQKNKIILTTQKKREYVL